MDKRTPLEIKINQTNISIDIYNMEVARLESAISLIDNLINDYSQFEELAIVVTDLNSRRDKFAKEEEKCLEKLDELFEILDSLENEQQGMQ